MCRSWVVLLWWWCLFWSSWCSSGSASPNEVPPWRRRLRREGDTAMTLASNGIGVGKGVGIAKAHVLRRGQADISHYSVPAHYLPDEVARYRAAVAAV